MQDWQEQYIRNVREIADIRPLFNAEETDFEAWYARHRKKEARLKALREENNSLLSTRLFALLDTLHGASEEDIRDLEAFSDQLMDWKNNLDCGVYVAIHDALLRLYLIRRNRDAIIRELYKLGMGLYYQNRSVLGIESREVESMHFLNEMVFTEAASYLRYFETIDNDETKGYILRALANISICSNNFKRRVGTSIKFIRIATSPAYRALAPNLPWDTYLRRAHQQLSTCRSQLSDKEFTKAEIAAVMDSCYEVFKPEAQSANPSIRWVWPYYDMEYACGYVDLATTVERLENLIRSAPEDDFSISGLYGTIQLPIILGRMLKKNEKLGKDPDHIEFLAFAYRRMMKALFSVPPNRWDDNFVYLLTLVVSDFYEVGGLISYREVTARLMQRFAGRLYLRSLTAGELLACLCGHIMRREPKYFENLPVFRNITDEGEREKTLLQFARDCGLYYDFGLFKMNMERMRMTRSLFESEDAMYRLHTVSGYEDLRQRESTRPFADIARGHHSSYTGKTDTSGYVRLESPYRQMTDLTALVADFLDQENADLRIWAKAVAGDRRFSPKAAAYLMEDEILDDLARILSTADRDSCRAAFEYMQH